MATTTEHGYFMMGAPGINVVSVCGVIIQLGQQLTCQFLNN